MQRPIRKTGSIRDGIGAINRRGSSLTNYLLFEATYRRTLVDLANRDTSALRGARVSAGRSMNLD
jgi:hypothetical protein